MPQARILVTGSRGLIGAALRSALHVEGYLTAGLDLLGHGLECGDVRSEDDVRRAMHGCNGVIHLAAVSRVAWAERDPAHERATEILARAARTRARFVTTDYVLDETVTLLKARGLSH